MSDMPPPPPPPPAEPAGQPAPQNPNTMAGLAHALLFTGFLGPLIVWLIGKDQSAFVDAEGKKALNFGILVSIAYVLVVIPFLGWLLWVAALACAIIFGIQGWNKASKGESYKYPFNVNLVK